MHYMSDYGFSHRLDGVRQVNMTPNGERQIIGPDRSQIFDAGVNFLSLRHQCENPYLVRHVDWCILA